MTSEGQIRIRSFPITNLARALFPGDDYFARELQMLFSEAHFQHLNGGGESSVTGLGQTLSTFVPEDVRLASPEWEERMAQRWRDELRPQLFAAMERFFVNGELVEQLSAQDALIVELGAAGVRIEGVDVLLKGIRTAGDWRQTFMTFVIAGRDRGVQTISGGHGGHRAIAIALQKAGFSVQDIRKIRDGSLMFGR